MGSRERSRAMLHTRVLELVEDNVVEEAVSLLVHVWLEAAHKEG